jgi:hypothetical protein
VASLVPEPSCWSAVSLASACICFLLIVSELVAFMRVDVVNHMTVDSTPSAGTVPISFDFTFPLVSCNGAWRNLSSCDYSSTHNILLLEARPRSYRLAETHWGRDCWADISMEAESTRGESVVHIEANRVQKMGARGDETSISQAGKGCNVKGTIFTSKVSRLATRPRPPRASPSRD